MLQPIKIFLEIGKKRSFAGAIDWPGWIRNGRDERLAIQALFAYCNRYAQVLSQGKIGFQIPNSVDDFLIVEQHSGNSTTDFGAPDCILSSDELPIDQNDLNFFMAIFHACWESFDRTIEDARGKTLQVGPRGGGRNLDKIILHVLEADASYLGRMARNFKPDFTVDTSQELSRSREAIFETLTAALQGEIPERGVRGGVIWKPRYFVRRVAWHVFDHMWEIEDRVKLNS